MTSTRTWMKCHRGLPRLLAVGLAAAALAELATSHAQSIPTAAIDALQWRSIGPSRGGRVTAVAGVPDDPFVYYMGATGGGVWKTVDAGQSWRNISDGFVQTGSVGAIAVAPSNARVLYVGMGESKIRGNFSHGDGVYRSRDAGQNFEHIGLGDSRQIGAIRVHPDDPDTLWVAAMGHSSGPNDERGVFRSTDGGQHWEKVLFVDAFTGACDLALDPQNPRVLFAAMWQVKRSGWALESGGPGSALYKSTDGGDTWRKIERGLPEGVLGRIGVSVSPLDSSRVWAIVEAEEGGVFVSKDGGESYVRSNADRELRQRAWYYTKIYADTEQVDTVYVLNVSFHKSQDGGKTFATIRTRHGDNHDLWIAPDNHQRMIEGNDGGAHVTFDGGQSWSTLDNQPTAQFYRVAVDTQHPYRVYGAQQDNSTVSISSAGGFRGRDDFYSVGGGESGYVVPRPDQPNIVYAGSYGGYLTRYDHATGKTRNIMVWPENPMGWGADALEERFQWNFPILLSPHDPNVLYVASQHVWRTDNEGVTWNRISPDLTTNDKSKQGPSGGPITKDNTGVEYYCTVFALAESPLEAGVLWAGSDDGRVHITRDGGATWQDVTPLDLPRWAQVNTIDASPHAAGTAWLAVTGYKQDDFTPYVFHTADYGASWSLRVAGIERQDFVRSVREDPVQADLLYAGTESSMYVSADGGRQWQSLQRNLPRVPVTDIVVKNSDLVIATQGRSFWILEELDLLRQWTHDVAAKDMHLFTPATAERGRDEATIRFLSREKPPESSKIEIVNSAGVVVHHSDGAPFRASSGLQVYRWDLRHADAKGVPGAVLWGGSLRGPLTPPGAYKVRVSTGDRTHEAELNVIGDPNVTTSAEDYTKQFELLSAIRDAISTVHGAVVKLRSARDQAQAMAAHAKAHTSADEIRKAAEELAKQLTELEERLIQTRSRSSQDPLNYPIQLNNKLAALAATISPDYAPGEQHHVVFAALQTEMNADLEQLDKVFAEQIPAFNALIEQLRVPAIVLPANDDTHATGQ